MLISWHSLKFVRRDRAQMRHFAARAHKSVSSLCQWRLENREEIRAQRNANALPEEVDSKLENETESGGYVTTSQFAKITIFTKVGWGKSETWDFEGMPSLDSRFAIASAATDAEGWRPVASSCLA